MGCLSSKVYSNEETKSDVERIDTPSVYLVEDAFEPREVANIWRVFEFRKNLGVGASCQVCLVKKRDTNELYALKIMNYRFTRLFEMEMEILKCLDCPNIVRLEGAYKDVRTQYICMEYCSGNSLFHRLSKKNTYSEAVAANSCKEMLQALKHIHDMNIVHRDIKPANFVYLTKDSNAGLKLLDFGMAIRVSPLEEYIFRVGTPYYMSPELVQNNETRSGDMCKKSDMWALGVCLFIILNGKFPFRGSGKPELFHNILKQKNLSFGNKGLSAEAKDFIFKLLRRDPIRRMTVDDALQHPWIVKSGMNDIEVMESTVEALRLFNAKHSVHRALQRLAAKKVLKYDKKYFKKLFDRFDRNGDGKISRAECIAVLEGSLMYTFEAAKVADEMISNSDDNKDETISWEEFQHSIARRDLSINEYKMHAVFCALDVNRDGHISTHELIHCLVNEEYEVECESLMNIVKVFNNATLESGRMTFDHFRKLLSDPKLRTSTFMSLESLDLMEVLDDNGNFIDDEPSVVRMDLVEEVVW